MNSLQLKLALFLALLIISGYLVMIFIGDKGLRDLNAMKEELRTLKAENEVLQQENIEMHRKIQRLKEDPEFIENIAREKFKMIGKDEIVFKFREQRTEKNQMPPETKNTAAISPKTTSGDSSSPVPENSPQPEMND